MKVIIISLWLDGEQIMSTKINAAGRFDYRFSEKYDRLTIEPDDENSRVEFTPDGAVYRP